MYYFFILGGRGCHKVLWAVLQPQPLILTTIPKVFEAVVFSFLKAGCPSYHPANSIKMLKAILSKC